MEKLRRAAAGCRQAHEEGDIGRIAIVIKPAKSPQALSNEPDNRILACAVESGADLIVPGTC